MKTNPNILLRLHQKEAKAGIVRTDVTHIGGKTLKVFYIIALAYTVVINFIYILSMNMSVNRTLNALNGTPLTAVQETELSQIRNSIVLVGAITVLLIAGLIFLLKRFFVPALIINCGSAAFLCLHFAERMSETLEQNGLLSSYSYNHLLPLSILFLTTLVYCIIGIKFVVGERKAYNAFCDALYKNYSDKFENLTDGDWQEFLENYEPPKK